MHRPTLIAALAGATLAAAVSTARADAPGDSSRPGHASAVEHPSRSRHHVWRRSGPPSISGRRETRAEAFDPSPAPGFAMPPHAGTAIFVQLREPYLPYGVVYNVPPEPAFAPPRAVIRARY